MCIGIKSFRAISKNILLNFFIYQDKKSELKIIKDTYKHILKFKII